MSINIYIYIYISTYTYSFKQQLIIEKNKLMRCVHLKIYVIRAHHSSQMILFFLSTDWNSFLFTFPFVSSSSSSSSSDPERRERLLTNRLVRENFIVTDFLPMPCAEKNLFFYFSCFVYNVSVRGNDLVRKTKHTVYIVYSFSCVCMYL